MLVDLGLDSWEKLFDHDVKSEIIVPAAQMKLLFICREYWGIELVGKVDENVVVLIDFAHFPKRSCASAQIPEQHLTNNRGCRFY